MSCHEKTDIIMVLYRDRFQRLFIGVIEPKHIKCINIYVYMLENDGVHEKISFIKLMRSFFLSSPSTSKLKKKINRTHVERVNEVPRFHFKCAAK